MSTPLTDPAGHPPQPPLRRRQQPQRWHPQRHRRAPDSGPAGHAPPERAGHPAAPPPAPASPTGPWRHPQATGTGGVPPSPVVGPPPRQPSAAGTRVAAGPLRGGVGGQKRRPGGALSGRRHHPQGAAGEQVGSRETRRQRQSWPVATPRHGRGGGATTGVRRGVQLQLLLLPRVVVAVTWRAPPRGGGPGEGGGPTRQPTPPPVGTGGERNTAAAGGAAMQPRGWQRRRRRGGTLPVPSAGPGPSAAVTARWPAPAAAAHSAAVAPVQAAAAQHTTTGGRPLPSHRLPFLLPLPLPSPLCRAGRCRCRRCRHCGLRVAPAGAHTPPQRWQSRRARGGGGDRPCRSCAQAGAASAPATAFVAGRGRAYRERGRGEGWAGKRAREKGIRGGGTRPSLGEGKGRGPPWPAGVPLGVRRGSTEAGGVTEMRGGGGRGVSRAATDTKGGGWGGRVVPDDAGRDGRASAGRVRGSSRRARLAVGVGAHRRPTHGQQAVPPGLQAPRPRPPATGGEANPPAVEDTITPSGLAGGAHRHRGPRPKQKTRGKKGDAREGWGEGGGGQGWGWGAAAGGRRGDEGGCLRRRVGAA